MGMMEAIIDIWAQEVWIFNTQLYLTSPPTLRQNFRLMGVTFSKGLNHNSDRNTGAELGTDRISHK